MGVRVPYWDGLVFHRWEFPMIRGVNFGAAPKKGFMTYLGLYMEASKCGQSVIWLYKGLEFQFRAIWILGWAA